MILVLGVTGTTGGATLQALRAMNVPVRVLVRDPSKFAVQPGVEVAVGDFGDPAALTAALDGVDHAYLVAPVSEQQIALETDVIDAARRAGVQHVVRLSVIGADGAEHATLRFGRAHYQLDKAVRESGMAWTFLQPNGFMQNYLRQAGSISGQNTIYSPLSPAARVSYVDARDIGEVAARALTEEGHEGKAYTLTGPEGLNEDEVAARFSAVLGRAITHTLVPAEAARQGMVQAGYPAWNADGIAELNALYESGQSAAVSPDIESVLGRPPRTFDAFVRDHRSTFSG